MMKHILKYIVVVFLSFVSGRLLAQDTSMLTRLYGKFSENLVTLEVDYSVKGTGPEVKGKAELRTLGKYYIADIGLRNFLLGYRDVDTGHIIENIVYLELVRRGFDVAVGKVGDMEIDFIATKDHTKIYYQVTDDMTAESTREHELAPLKAVRDNYEKAVIAMTTNSTTQVEGIKIIRLIDFLLES